MENWRQVAFSPIGAQCYVTLVERLEKIRFKVQDARRRISTVAVENFSPTMEADALAGLMGRSWNEGIHQCTQNCQATTRRKKYFQFNYILIDLEIT